MPGIRASVIPDGKKVRSLRDGRNWSRKELVDRASRLHLPISNESTLYKVEQGKPVSQDTIEALSRLFDVSYNDLVLPAFQRMAAAESGEEVDPEIDRFLDRNKLARNVAGQYIELYHSPAWRGWKRDEVDFRYLGDYTAPPELKALMKRYAPDPPVRGYFSLHRCSPYPIGDERRPLVVEAYGGTYHHVFALTKIYENRQKDSECARFRVAFEDSWVSTATRWPLEASPLYHNINAEVLVLTADNQLVLGKRHEELGFYGGAWSTTLEEQMLRHDPEKPEQRDTHLFDAADRGVREELGANVIAEKTTLLAIGIEWGNFTAAFLFLVYCAETFDELINSWTKAKHDPYEAIALDCVPVDGPTLSLVSTDRRWTPSTLMTARVGKVDESGGWHPTAKARLEALRCHLDFLRGR